NDGGLEGADDVVDRGVNLAHLARLAHARDKKAAELKDGDRTDHALVGGQHRKNAHIVRVDQFQRLGAGGLGVNGDDVGDHDVADPRGDVAEQDGQGLVELFEDGVDARVGVAAAGRDVSLDAARLLVGGVGDGGADRIGVRIFVTDDV